jgi:hypothetical protein
MTTATATPNALEQLDVLVAELRERIATRAAFDKTLQAIMDRRKEGRVTREGIVKAVALGAKDAPAELRRLDAELKAIDDELADVPRQQRFLDGRIAAAREANGQHVVENREEFVEIARRQGSLPVALAAKAAADAIEAYVDAQRTNAGLWGRANLGLPAPAPGHNGSRDDQPGQGWTDRLRVAADWVKRGGGEDRMELSKLLPVLAQHLRADSGLPQSLREHLGDDIEAS